MRRVVKEVTTRDGIRISFAWYRSPGCKAVVIICPGFFQSKETATFKRLATTLSALCDVVCMDFRGHGRSTGRFTFSAREQADLGAVIHSLGDRYERIGLIGFSLGAATAINFASHQDGIRTLIAVSAPSAFEAIEFKFWTPGAIRTGIRGLKPGAGCRPSSPWLKKERPVENIRRMSAIPVHLIHGTGDQTISYHHSERLYQAAKQPKRLILIKGGGHAEELFQRSPEQFVPPIETWLKIRLLR